MLVDPATFQLAALPDFGFAYVGGQLDEYLISFSDFAGELPGPARAATSLSQQARRDAIVTGSWGSIPSVTATRGGAT